MKISNIMFALLLIAGSFLFIAKELYATSPYPILDKLATQSGEATMSADKEATASIQLNKKIVTKEPDITEPKPEVKGKLEKYLDENPIGELSPFNVIRYAIRYAVSQGVPANTLVLILLFPLIATVVVFSRHIIGLKSFGIFTPALLSVALLATGLTTGIGLFFFILFVATIVRIILKRIRIQYLPRMAMFMLFISLSIFSVLLISPSIGNSSLINIGIFPLLILILLVEDFLDLQITRNLSQAFIITLETLILAVGCFYLMNWDLLQKFALVNPEVFIISVLVAILLIEQYSGLRILEIWRFRKILK